MILLVVDVVNVCIDDLFDSTSTSNEEMMPLVGVPRWRTMEGHTFALTLRNQRFRQVTCSGLDAWDPEGASRV